MTEDLKLAALQRIASALEDIAAAMHVRTVDTAMRFTDDPQQRAAVHADMYAAAVQSLVDLPDDIPAAPAPKAEPPEKSAVISALNAYARLHGVEAGKKVIASFGVKRLDEIPQDKWADVIALCGVAR